jgi:hypothetical protein
VRAWTLWVHESDVEATALVRNAGHALDAAPEGMGCALDELVAPARRQRARVGRTPFHAYRGRRRRSQSSVSVPVVRRNRGAMITVVRGAHEHVEIHGPTPMKMWEPGVGRLAEFQRG